MLYDIALTISYTFEHPAAAVRNILRIQPMTLPGEQTLISGLVSATPAPDDITDGRDFFGNAQTEVCFGAPHRDFGFRFAGRIERMARIPQMDFSPRLGQIAAEVTAASDIGPASPHHFTGASDRVEPDPDITAFARDHLDATASVLASVRGISSALHSYMTFDPEATDVETPARDSFLSRKGVCQDFSHVMIAALRGVGIPAGYVSGFLRTVPPPGQERLDGADAMHAWVRAWCGAEMGWVEIDPTNDMMVGTDHIVVARGRDYADVAPVRGSLRGVGTHETRHKVDVVPAG